MDEQGKKIYVMDPLTHYINVVHLYSNYHYMKIMCPVCKFRDLCAPVKHKREICAVSQRVEHIFGRRIRAKLSSFASDDFYLSTNKSNQAEQEYVANAIKQIQNEYVINKHERG